MKLWITGKNGLLGSLLKEKADLATGREVDVSDLRAVRDYLHSHEGVTHIVNCAAYSLVDGAEKEKEEAVRANVEGPENLARVAREIGARFVHISTDYVFDGKITRPLQENDPPSPLSHYGRTKLEGEVRVFRELPGACIIRTSWLFGPGGKNFVTKLLHMLKTQEEIHLTDDHWGRPTYALDLAQAICFMWDRSGLFHFANRGETTKYLFGCKMREEALRQGIPLACKRMIPVPATTFPSPCQRPPYSAFDTGKIEKHLPIRHWELALRDYLCSAS